MRHLYLMLLAIPLIAVSCMSSYKPARSFHTQDPEYVVHYKLLVHTPLEVYESILMRQRYRDIPAGDTVDVVLASGVELSPTTTEAYYKQYKLNVWGLGTRTKTLSAKRYNRDDFKMIFQEPTRTLTPDLYPLYFVVKREQQIAQAERKKVFEDSSLRATSVAEYTLLVNSPLEVYDANITFRFPDVAVRDTIRVLLREDSQLSPSMTKARHKGRDIYVFGAGVRTKLLSRKVYKYGDYLSSSKGVPLSLHTYGTDEIKNKDSSIGGNDSSSYSGAGSYGGTSNYSNGTRYSTPTTGATIHTGPRGGRYYYNSNGNKTYIRRK